MILPLDIHRQAKADVIDHAAYLGRFNPDIGLRFIRAAHETYQFLAEFPGVGAFYKIEDPSIPALRKWPVKGFEKYLIFYRDEGSVLEVVRVVHGASDIPTVLRNA